jgi:hypothetical protein
MSDPFAYDINDAFYGPLGEYARRTEETVEVDALTHLAQVVTAAGTAIGRRAATRGGHSFHYPNLYTLIIGDSGIGKGVSWELAAQLGEAIDPGFKKRTAYDVASAQGLIRLISDGTSRPSRKRSKDGEEREYEIVTPAVPDKRLLLQIPEMMTVFTSKERDGSTLGEALHNAWDGKDLQNNTKHDRDTATNPHISLVGHITPVDFAKAVSDNRRDLRNGFFNRFILLRARNVRVLPFYVPPPDCRDLFSTMRERLDRLGPVAQPEPHVILDWHSSARQLWREFYSAWRQNTHPFLQGMNGLQSRLAPNAMRVALNHAIFEGADAIYDRHLHAGKAHALASFYSSQPLVGNSEQLATDLTDVLRATFANRQGEWLATELHEMTGRRFGGSDLTQAAGALVQAGVWQCREGRKGNGHTGRIYRLAGSSNDREPCIIPDPFEDLVNTFSPEREQLFENQTEDAALTADSETAAEDIDPNVFTINGMRLRRVTPFSIRYDADALTVDDRQTGVQSGQEGFLVAIDGDATPTQRDRAHALIAKKPNHVLAAIGGELLFVKVLSLRLNQPALASA